MTLFASIADRKALTSTLAGGLQDIESECFEVYNEEVGSLTDTSTDLYDLERQLLQDANAFYNDLAKYRAERGRIRAAQAAEHAEYIASEQTELGYGHLQHERI